MAKKGLKQKKGKNISWLVISWITFAEFLLLLDAAFVGFTMDKGYKPSWEEILFFWGILIISVVMKHTAEVFKENYS